MKCVAIDDHEQRCPKDVEWRIYYFGDPKLYLGTDSIPQWVYIFVCADHVGDKLVHACRVDKDGELIGECAVSKPQKG